MRRFIFFNLLLWAATTISYCQEVTDFYVARNQDYSLPNEDGSVLTASDVLSARNKIVRKISLSQPFSRIAPSELLITLESTNIKTDLYYQLQNAPATFSGTMKIEMAGVVLSSVNIVNGLPSQSIFTSKLYSESTDPVYNPNVKCTLGTVHDCVAWNIEGMNWLEYGLCMIRAPICYLQQWSGCFKQVCRNHMQYTNPN